MELAFGPVCALLDSGAVRSLMSDVAYNSLMKALPSLHTYPVTVKCVTASAQTFPVHTAVKCRIRIDRYTWKVPFYVVPGLIQPVILGADFLGKTGLMIDVQQGHAFFRFDPTNRLHLLGRSPPDDKSWVCAATSANPDLSHLEDNYSTLLRSLIDDFPDVLTPRLGLTTLLQYDIELLDPSPVKIPPYRLMPPKMDILRQHIRLMLDEGIIQPSTSPYSSPIFLVPKGQDGFRPVIDYRALNKKIKIESVPLPDIHSCFHWFKTAKVFTSLDLNSAYHQIGLTDRSKPLTAFATDWNLYEYTRVPFGLATGAQVLTRLLDKVFSDLKFNFVFHYLDDLVVYSDSFEEHVLHLREVFLRLRNAGLTVNPAKVRFATPHLSFLGHIVGPSGISVDPSRTDAIRRFPPPRDVKGVARFIGMVNFFHKFIPHFAERAAPLNLLRKKDVKFQWGPDQIRAFQDLKLAITNPPVLRTADFSRRFTLQTDASSVAVAAVLLQQFDGELQPIAYASRTLSHPERKFSTYELECLAVLFGLEKFRPYLEHLEFDLQTDNQALTWCLSHPRQLGRIGRWVVRLSSFKFNVQHIRGTQNVIADALSRMYDPSAENPVCSLLLDFPVLFEDIATHQRKDPEICPIMDQLSLGQEVPGYSLLRSVLYCKARFDGRPKIVIPQALIPALFSYFHDSPCGGHLGVRKTLWKIRQSFIWKGMDADISARVRACKLCGLSKPAQNARYGMLASDVATRPLEKLFVDFVGKFPRSKAGNTYALVCVDAFTKFVWIFPVREASTATTIRVLLNIFSTFGIPEVLVSDNATQFTSRNFRNFCFARGIRHVTTTPYYPQPSHAERFNRNLRAALIAYHHQDHSRWDENLSWLQFAFNSARHESHKTTPFSLMFSFTPNSPLSNLWSIKELLPETPDFRSIQERWEAARRNLRLAHAAVRRTYDRGRQPPPFHVGSRVWLKNYPLSKASQHVAAKLCPRYRGPFTVVKFTSPVSVQLTDSDGGSRIRAHVSQLKAA